MKTLLTIAFHIYRQAIRFYPQEFRDTFGDEMLLVFQEHAHQSSLAGWSQFVGVILHELWDAPGAIVAAHWDQLSSTLLPRAPLQMMQNLQSALAPRRFLMTDRWNTEWHMESNRQFIIAGMPPLLLGLGIAGVSLIRGGPWHAVPVWRLALSIALPGILVLAMAIIGLIALFKGIPDWGLTWVATSSMGFLLLLEVSAEELAEVGMLPISETGSLILMVLLLLTGLVLLIFIGMRGWHRAGLFSIGLSATLTLALYMSVTAAPFYRHDLAVYAAPLGLAISALTYLYIRSSTTLRVVTLLALAILNTTAPLLLNHAMRQWFAKEGNSPVWPLLILLTGLLLSGPLISLLTKPLQRIMKPS